MYTFFSVDPVFQQMITDYHKRLESALCHHSNQYLAHGGQGHILDTDIDLLLLNQAYLEDSFGSCKAGVYNKFQKHSVLNEHNLNFQNRQPHLNNGLICNGDNLNFQNSQPHLNNELICNGGQGQGQKMRRSGFNDTNHNSYHGIEPVKKQWNTTSSHGNPLNDLDIPNGQNPRTFDVNTWYDNCYYKEQATWGREETMSTRSSKY